HRFLGRRGAHGGVHDQQHHVRGGHRQLGLRGDRRLQALGVRLPAAGVDQGEAAPGPRGVVSDPVPGHARRVLHDRFPPAEDPVDQRRLAHVRPADHRDHRLRLQLLAVVGRRRLACGVDLGELRLRFPGAADVPENLRHLADGVLLAHRASLLPGAARPAPARHLSSSATVVASRDRNVSVPASKPSRPRATSRVNGSPNSRSTVGRKRRLLPGGRAGPRAATGTTRAPDARTNQAAPCSAFSTLPEPRVPSGNTATKPPLRSSRTASSSGVRSGSPRRTDNWPIRRSNVPVRPPSESNSSSLTKNTERRGTSPKISCGSISDVWLAISTTGPVLGTRSTWCTRMRYAGRYRCRAIPRARSCSSGLAPAGRPESFTVALRWCPTSRAG